MQSSSYALVICQCAVQHMMLINKGLVHWLVYQWRSVDGVETEPCYELDNVMTLDTLVRSIGSLWDASIALVSVSFDAGYMSGGTDHIILWVFASANLVSESLGTLATL